MGLRKGDCAFIVNGRAEIEAIIIDVITESIALIRVMSGVDAGKEVKVEFLPGELDYTQKKK